VRKQAGKTWRISRYGKFFKVEKRWIPLVWVTVKKPLTTAGITRSFPVLFATHKKAEAWIRAKDPQGKINFPRNK